MKAVVLYRNGPPDVFVHEERPDPVPGPSEVLVRVGAVGVPYHDIVERNGTLRPGQGLPKIMGNEIAGTVVARGPGTGRLSPGDRVCATGFHVCGQCRFCRTGRETACPERRVVSGGYAELAAIPEAALVPIPDNVDFASACMLGSSTAVALGALRDRARLRLGETLLVTGASGGVGLSLVQIGKLLGARVIGVSRSAGKTKAIREAGADEVVVMDDTGDFSRAVRNLTGGNGVDVVGDSVGSRVFWPAFRSLDSYGRYLVIGQLSGERVELNPAHILFKSAEILGVTNARRDQLVDTVDLVSKGAIRPRIAAVMRLDEVARAHAMVEAGTVIGRVVLDPGLR